MMSLARTLMGVVLLLAAASVRALGPPNGTAGMLDFRYPDHIVEPLVDCPSEGFFPHPRNNNWFYRCYDPYSYGYFWRAYLQCPPCTVFSDALDQCVFQETGSQCLPPVGSCQKTIVKCRLTIICNFGNSNSADHAPVEVCIKAILQCPGQPDKPLCRDGFVYAKTHDGCRVDGWYNCPVPTEEASPNHTTTSDPQPTPTTTPTTTTKRAPTDVNDYIDNFFVCELAGSRPSAEGYRTLGCSERQFCNNNGFQLAPITGCQWYLECDFTAPGVLQLVPKQCPSGQFFFYGNVNQCVGQGQLDLYDCHQSSTAATTTTTTTTTTTQVPSTTQPQPTTTTPPEPTTPEPSFSPNDCTYHGETLGIKEHEVTTYCRRSCADSGGTLDTYRYCDKFYQCSKDQETQVFEEKLTECGSTRRFDRKISKCIKITGSRDCVILADVHLF